MPEVILPAHDYAPRWYQCPVWNHFVPDASRKRAVVIAHRRWGKDLLAVNMTAGLTQQRVGSYYHILPFAKQARAVLWNGMSSPTEEEEKKGKIAIRFQDAFPSGIVEKRNEQEMRIHLKGGSVWQAVGGDDANKLVGTNPIGIVFSEFALMDPALLEYMRPIVRQNRGWILFITTIRGRNHAWTLLQRAEKLQRNDPNWLAVNSKLSDTNAISQEDLEQERKEGMSEAMIAQEYFNSPEAPIQGAYYSNELQRAEKEGRITSVPWEPRVPVNVAFDIGFSDSTVMVFYQQVGMEVRIIDYYTNSGEELAHYVNVIRSKDYSYDKFIAPWDVEIKHLAAGGKSVYDVGRSLGIRFTVAPQPRTVADGIEQCRNIFPSCWFDKVKCERLLEALAAYRKEPLPAKMQYTGEHGETAYKDTPLHDWSSHGSDGFRTMAWAIKRSKSFANTKRPQEFAEDTYSYL